MNSSSPPWRPIESQAVERLGKVSLLVLDVQWLVGYLQVYCDAVVHRDPTLVVDVMMAVGGRMSGEQLGDEARPFVEQMAIDEGRVVLRCRPYATFATPHRDTRPATTKTKRCTTNSRPIRRGPALLWPR